MARDAFEEAAVSHGLTYVHDCDPGLRRVTTPKGVVVEDAEGREVRDSETLERIRRLAIPPAWTDVWICGDPDGHIQAAGRDARRRKQYRYHAGWRACRDEAKYESLLAFGEALPRLRERVANDLALRGLPREKVLAAVVRLLEMTLIRVGNDEYAKANKSFGLTTLRKRHVTLTGAGAVFEFRGKSGVAHRTGFHDARLARVLRGCEALPGQRLFQYVDHEGARHVIGSHDVNAYIREAAGEDFTAKTFRTWVGTLLAARALALQPKPETAAQSKKAIATAVKAVAGMLRNTSAVCRACYIHPTVLEAYETGALPPELAGEPHDAEGALLDLMRAGLPQTKAAA
ncbi:MAG TPA: DNA topoisomerase IB [Caulobacteraceae bacterium]|jgi:DNA topoisomerase-1|nr:DNA topoisomerase IB [Caulobacteraceae bacterium]